MSTTETTAIRISDAECIRKAVEAHREVYERNIATYTDHLKNALRRDLAEDANVWRKAIADETLRLETITSVETYAAEVQG